MTPLPVTLEELYMLVGERETIRYKQQQQIQTLLDQVDEMAKVITELREERNKIAEERQELQRKLNELTQDGA